MAKKSSSNTWFLLLLFGAVAAAIGVYLQKQESDKKKKEEKDKNELEAGKGIEFTVDQDYDVVEVRDIVADPKKDNATKIKEQELAELSRAKAALNHRIAQCGDDYYLIYNNLKLKMNESSLEWYSSLNNKPNAKGACMDLDHFEQGPDVPDRPVDFGSPFRTEIVDSLLENRRAIISGEFPTNRRMEGFRIPPGVRVDAQPGAKYLLQDGQKRMFSTTPLYKSFYLANPNIPHFNNVVFELLLAIPTGAPFTEPEEAEVTVPTPTVVLEPKEDEESATVIDPNSLQFQTLEPVPVDKLYVKPAPINQLPDELYHIRAPKGDFVTTGFAGSTMILKTTKDFTKAAVWRVGKNIVLVDPSKPNATPEITLQAKGDATSPILAPRTSSPYENDWQIKVLGAIEPGKPRDVSILALLPFKFLEETGNSSEEFSLVQKFVAEKGKFALVPVELPAPAPASFQSSYFITQNHKTLGYNKDVDRLNIVAFDKLTDGLAFAFDQVDILTIPGFRNPQPGLFVTISNMATGTLLSAEGVSRMWSGSRNGYAVFELLPGELPGSVAFRCLATNKYIMILNGLVDPRGEAIQSNTSWFLYDAAKIIGS